MVEIVTFFDILWKICNSMCKLAFFQIMVTYFFIFPPCVINFSVFLRPPPPLAPFFGIGIDKQRKLCYISTVKSYDEDTHFGKLPRERSVWCKDLADLPKWYHFWAIGWKWPIGCARYCVNEWRSYGRNQGGTVEYICIPPLICQGWVFFMPSPEI